MVLLFCYSRSLLLCDITTSITPLYCHTFLLRTSRRHGSSTTMPCCALRRVSEKDDDAKSDTRDERERDHRLRDPFEKEESARLGLVRAGQYSNDHTKRFFSNLDLFPRKMRPREKGTIEIIGDHTTTHNHNDRQHNKQTTTTATATITTCCHDHCDPSSPFINIDIIVFTMMLYPL